MAIIASDGLVVSERKILVIRDLLLLKNIDSIEAEDNNTPISSVEKRYRMMRTPASRRWILTVLFPVFFSVPFQWFDVDK